MASTIGLKPPSTIHVSHQGHELASSQQYCGVCHGVLNVNESSSRKTHENDAILRTSSSSESFPLPSSAAAVGTVHPCGHVFHVSCFHNHNNKLQKKGTTKSCSHKGNPMVEIFEDDGASCVEIKSSDEFEDSLTHEDFNECPTCRKRAFLFVEMSSTVMHKLHLPLSDAVDKMSVDACETDDDDDADTDIMNYYSFGNTGSDDGENLFVDTTNIMAHNLMTLGIANAHRNMKHSHSDASTEYHDVQSISGKLAASAGAILEHRDEQVTSDGKSKQGEAEPAGSGATVVAHKPQPGSNASKQLPFFDPRALPTTPGIMITPGTMQRRKANKKVRFFDDFSHSLLERHGASGGEPQDSNSALIDRVGSEEEDREDSEVVEITDEDVQDEAVAKASSQKKDDENVESDNDSTTIPLASSTEDSQEEEMLTLANGLILPSSDSKMLLWNVSTYEEEDDLNHDFVDKLQREIDTLRHQLIQSEQQKENAQRSISLSRTRDMGAAATQSKILRLKKEVERLTAQQTVNQEDIMATEEELATTQIQLETAIDSHQQAQAKLQDKMDKALEELEEVKYQLETCQQDLEQATKAALSEKVELVASQGKCEEEMKQEYDAKLESLQDLLSQAQSELEENKSQLETCKQQIEEQSKSAEEEKETLVAKHDHSQKEHDTQLETLRQELNSAHEELQQTKSELKLSQENSSEQSKTAQAEKENLEAMHKESEHQMTQEHETAVKELQDTIIQTNTQLKVACLQVSATQEELQVRMTTAMATNAALVAKHKGEICGLKEEYGTKLVGFFSKVENLEAELEQEKISNADLAAKLEQSRKVSELSSSEMHAQIEKQKDSNKNLLAQLDQVEAWRVELLSELKGQKQSNQDLQSQLEGSKQAVESSLSKLQSELLGQMDAYSAIKIQLENAQTESEASRAGLESELARQKESNAALELQLERMTEQSEKAITDLQSELDTQKESATAPKSQHQQSLQGSQQLQEEMKKSISELKSELEKQTQWASSVGVQLQQTQKRLEITRGQLQQTQKRLEITSAELVEARAVNLDESEEMNIVKEEMESTKPFMEKIIANMQASEREMIVLRKELNLAKDALASSTNDLDLQRMSTSTSSLSPRHSADESTCVHSLQDELRVVKQELSAKNQFIQGQLTMAKGKLIEYVRTKEGELEHTKKELAQTKQALKQKNISFGRQLQETEHELQELSSMKETLLTTMNELAEKNSIITCQLMDAHSELAFLEKTNDQLRAANKQRSKGGNNQHALAAVPDLKLGNAFAVAAVFMGHWLSECAKAKFHLKSNAKSKEEADPIPEIDTDLVT